MQTTIYNYTIDKFKFMAAIAVVLIHVTAFLDTENQATFANYYWYRHLLNFAVPFFFATTGYLLAQQTDAVTYIKRHLNKTLRLYTVLSVFYMVIDGFIFIPASLAQQQSFIQASKDYLNTFSISKLLNGQIGHYHLWYLWALFLASLILYHMIKSGLNSRQMFITASFIYLISLFVISKNAHGDLLANGGFPKALICLTTGYYIGQRDLTIKNGLAISLILLLSYQRLSLSDNHFFAGESLLIGAIATLITYTKHKTGRPTPLAKLANYSMEIYLFHPILLTIYSYITKVRPHLEIQPNGLKIGLLTTITIAVSVSLGPILNRYYIAPTEKRLASILNTLITHIT